MCYGQSYIIGLWVWFKIWYLTIKHGRKVVMHPLNIQIFPGSYWRSSKFKEHDKVFTHPPTSVQNPKCHSMKSGWLKTGLLESSTDRVFWTLLIFLSYFSGLNSECLCIQVPCFWVRSLTFNPCCSKKNMLKASSFDQGESQPKIPAIRQRLMESLYKKVVISVFIGRLPSLQPR